MRLEEFSWGFFFSFSFASNFAHSYVSPNHFTPIKTSAGWMYYYYYPSQFVTKMLHLSDKFLLKHMIRLFLQLQIHTTYTFNI